ncbi:MAG: ATP-binding protein [Gracilibacteraceae bacterium]|jgi:predicted AAA+ superfamily ATPase|nr:ATP-binding protein [Gracilibacteraceae bacterium]
MNQAEEARRECRMLALACRGLSVFTDLAEDGAARAMLALLTAVGAQASESETVYGLYHEVYRLTADKAWDSHVLDLILLGENRLARACPALAGRAREDAARDLRILRELASLDGEKVLSFVTACFEDGAWGGGAWAGNFLVPRHWPRWRLAAAAPAEGDAAPEAPAQAWLRAKREALKTLFYRSRDWSALIEALLCYYREAGCGVFADFAVFRLLENGALEGVENPDPVTVDRLFCQEREQNIVLRNTEIFLRGLAASNVILYGNRGTGKSSLVKALPNAYAARGLRLIQMKKTEIRHFTALTRTLAALPYKFVLYIDDLSFDETEQDYKDMKMLLEGGVEARPPNVLVYATSNRKNLIRETFSERRGDEVHVRDNMEEKLSLADRFGITVTFLAPDQDTFLAIVAGLAEGEGSTLPAAELRRQALLWVQRHNARSGRSARQFIDDLRGEIALRREIKDRDNK